MNADSVHPLRLERGEGRGEVSKLRLEGLQHATAAEWFDYISAIPEVEYGWVEWQPYEFAGRLLVPPDVLREAFQAAIQSAQAAGYSDWLAADEAALNYIATRIAPKFGVTVETNLPQRGQKKIAQGCSHNARATLGKRPNKYFSLSSSNEERAGVRSRSEFPALVANARLLQATATSALSYEATHHRPKSEQRSD